MDTDKVIFVVELLKLPRAHAQPEVTSPEAALIGSGIHFFNTGKWNVFCSLSFLSIFVPVAHARTQRNPFGFTWPSAICGSHGTCTTFCTTIVRKKARGKSGHTQNILPWRHFRSGLLSVTSLPVVHAHVITSSSSTTNMTLSVPIYYYYSKKKAREPVSHAHAITSVTSGSGPSVTIRAASGHVTSGNVTSGSTSLEHLPKCGLNRTDILLMSQENSLKP